MADPRLQWKELRGPDFRDAILASRSAGEGLNDAFDSATSILGRYEAGRTRKNDLEVRQELAGIGDEASWNKWLAAGGLRGRQVGDEVAGLVSGGLKSVLGFQGDRANISNTESMIRDRDGRLVIAQNADGRIQQNHDWDYAARAENARLAAAGVGARIEGRQGGYGNVSPDAPASLITTESGGNYGASNNAVGHGGKAGHFGRVQFGHARLEDAKRAGVLPPNMTTQQFLQNPELQQRAEAWHFADIQNNIDKMGLSKYEGANFGGTPITRDGMVAMAHLGGIGGLQRYLQSGGLYDPADDNGTKLSDYAKTHAGNTTGGGGNGRNQGIYEGTFRGGVGGPQATGYYDQLSGAQYQTVEAMNGLLDPIFSSQSFGQGQLDDEAARRAAIDQQLVAETNATTLDDIIRSSGVTSREEGYAWIDGLNIPASEKAAMRQAFDIRAETDPTFAPASTDPGTIAVQEAAGQTIAALEHANASSDQNQRLDRIDQFTADPAGALETALGADQLEANQAGGISRFFRGNQKYSKGELDGLITEYTTRLNRAGKQVTRETVAAAMYEAYENDPWGSNTLKNRFNYDTVQSLVEQNFTGESLSNARERRGVTRQRTADLKAKENTYKTLTSKLEKALRNGNQKEAAKLQEKINKVQGEIADLVKDNQGYLAN